MGTKRCLSKYRKAVRKKILPIRKSTYVILYYVNQKNDVFTYLRIYYRLKNPEKLLLCNYYHKTLFMTDGLLTLLHNNIFVSNISVSHYGRRRK